MHEGSSGVRGKESSFIQGMNQTWDDTKDQFKDFRTDLPSKEDIRKKLTKKNAEKVGEGLKKGSIKMLRITSGVTLLSLSVITPKNQSEELSQKGMKMLRHIEDKEWGINSRKKIKYNAQILFRRAMEEIGAKIEGIAKERGGKLDLTKEGNSKKLDRLQNIELGASRVKINAQEKQRRAKQKLNE